MGQSGWEGRGREVETGWGRVVGRGGVEWLREGGVEKHCVVTMVRWIMWVWLCDMMCCAMFCGGCDVLCCVVL